MISEIAAYLALAIVLIWTFRNPVLGVGAYWVVALARPHDVFWYSLGESHLSLPVALVVCILWIVRWNRRNPDGVNSGTVVMNALVLTFLLLKVVAAIMAPDQTAAWDHVEKVAKIVIFYFATVGLISNRTDLRAISLVAAVSIAFLGVWGNWQWYVEGIGGGPMGELAGPGWEIGAALTDRSLFGYMLAIGIPICFFVFVTERAPWLRWPALASLPFLSNAVMLTFGRAAFLGMIAGSLFAVIRLRRPRVVFATVIIGALMMYRLAGPEVVSRIMSIEDYEEDQSAVSRLESWKAGFAIILDHPLLGIGPGNYGRFSSVYNEQVKEGLVAHNEFIETAAESGIPAAIVLIAIITLMFRNTRWVRKRTWAAPDTRWAYYHAAMIESAMVTYLVGAMFASLPFFEIFYLLLALSVVLRRVVAGLPATSATVAEANAPRTVDPTNRTWWRRVVRAPNAV